VGFLLRVVVNILAIVVAASVIPGIRLDGVLPAVAAGLLLGVINAFVRPVLLVLTLPITLVTLGLFLFVLNGLCLWFVASVVTGFHVAGFWSAVLGALCVSVVSWLVTVLVSDSGKVVVITRRPRG
jgi:putative membrane protein